MRLLAFILVFVTFKGAFGQQIKLRPLADTIGFAHTATQMDSVIKRIMRSQGKTLTEKRKEADITDKTIFKTVVAPHDDYTYAGYMYPLALQNIKAKTVVLFGVAHKAKNFGAENKLIFDNYTHWRGPYGNVKVSPFREQIISLLPEAIYSVNDSMQKTEHSIEAEIPFLQYYNPNVEIISILVPYMDWHTMDSLSNQLGNAIAIILQSNRLRWGKDVALVISADAVHYGDEDWGGRNFAYYGADSAGYKKAVAHETGIMDTCFSGETSNSKINTFTRYTVQKENYKEYKWTWCGRYSVPFGVATALKLNRALMLKPLTGKILSYETSLSNKPIPVKDLGGMGTTANATIHHWVGFPAIGFK